jgi:hypothetical protein
MFVFGLVSLWWRMYSSVLLGKLDVEDPEHDDFELWSPSEERADRCLFGRQVNKSCLARSRRW